MAYKTHTSNSGTASSSTLVVNVPATIAENDIAIIAWAADDPTPGTMAYPSGFAELSIESQTTDGQTSGIIWKRCTGAESGTFDITGSNIGTASSYVIACVLFNSRHTTNNPEDTSNESDAANGSPVTITATGVTAVSGDDLMWVGAPDPTSSGGVDEWTGPADFTERVNLENGFSDLYVGTRDNVNAGATGDISASYTLSAGSSAWAAYLVRIPSDGSGGATAWGPLIALRNNRLVGTGLVG